MFLSRSHYNEHRDMSFSDLKKIPSLASCGMFLHYFAHTLDCQNPRQNLTGFGL
jgi:hypothetical protein